MHQNLFPLTITNGFHCANWQLYSKTIAWLYWQSENSIYRIWYIHPNGNEVRKLKITSHEKLTGLVIVIAKFKLPSYHVNDTIRFDFYAKGQLAQFVPQDLFFFWICRMIRHYSLCAFLLSTSSCLFLTFFPLASSLFLLLTTLEFLTPIPFRFPNLKLWTSLWLWWQQGNKIS